MSSAVRRLLLVSKDSNLRQTLPPAMHLPGARLSMDVAARVVDALPLFRESRFDAVVCTVDTPDELACILKLRETCPEVPVVMLIEAAYSRLESLGLQVGASSVVVRGADLAATAALLHQAARTPRLARNLRGISGKTTTLSHDILDLTRSSITLLGNALGLVAAAHGGRFVTLLVEDDPNEAFFVVRAFSRAGLPPFLKPLRSAEAAIAYLEGKRPFADRAACPEPSLILADLRLGAGATGLDLLKWVRAHPKWSDLGFVMMSETAREIDVREATRERANACVVKTEKMEGLIELVKAIYAKSMLNPNRRASLDF